MTTSTAASMLLLTSLVAVAHQFSLALRHAHKVHLEQPPFVRSEVLRSSKAHPWSMNVRHRMQAPDCYERILEKTI